MPSSVRRLASAWLDDLLEFLGAVADFQDRDARAGQGQQVALGLFQGGQGQNGRTGREIVDALFHVRFLLSKTKSTRDESDVPSKFNENPGSVQGSAGGPLADEIKAHINLRIDNDPRARRWASQASIPSSGARMTSICSLSSPPPAATFRAPSARNKWKLSLVRPAELGPSSSHRHCGAS